MVLLMPAVLFAQTGITGRITTSDGKPIPAVNILLLNPGDTSLVKGCIANALGEFALEKIVPGKYFLRYTAIGFRTCHSFAFELSAADGKKDLPVQVMETEARELKEVVVQAQKPLYQQQIYGTVVNVENSVFTKGSSALQVLERSPGIYLDRHHNTISLNGKDGVMVMLNGKLLRMPLLQVINLLNGMNADNIEKVELMTTPPAKYDADGDAGMINIVLKKSKKTGTNGSFSLTGGYGWGEKIVASANLEHNGNKVNVYGSYSFSHDRTYANWFAHGGQNMPLLGGQTSFDFWSDIRPVYDNHNVIAGLDARLSPKTKVGANVNYNYTRAVTDMYNIGNYYIQPDSFLQLKANIGSRGHWNNLITSVYLEKNIREGEGLEFNVDYIFYNNDYPSFVESSWFNKENREVSISHNLFAQQQRGLSNIDINVGVGKVDYTKQLSSKVKLEAGAKWTYTVSSGTSALQSYQNGAWENFSGRSNGVDMKENIGAGYASVNAKLSATVNLIAGGRYEYSHNRLTDQEKGALIVDRKLGKFLPAVFVTKKLNESSSLELSFTKRISRPSYIDLTPDITYNDPVSVFTGNPMLKPTITNNLKLGYNYLGYSISVMAGRDDNSIARYQVVPDAAGNIIYIAPENLTWQNNLIFDVKVPVKIADWWNINFSSVGGWKQFKIEYTVKPVKKTYFDYSFYLNQVFKLPKNFSLEISGMYNSITYRGANRMAGFGMVNAGIKKELKNNGGVLQLSVTDIFKSMYSNSSLGKVTDIAFSLRSFVDYNTETRTAQIVKLTYSRSFGNNAIKSQRKTAAGSKDERDRMRKE
jgi:iron complex outermembrane recepter protein